MEEEGARVMDHLMYVTMDSSLKPCRLYDSCVNGQRAVRGFWSFLGFARSREKSISIVKMRRERKSCVAGFRR
jgi:hypothetical protein